MRIRWFAPAPALLLFACSSAIKTPPPEAKQVGDQVTLGNLSYTVFGRQWRTEFGSGIDARVPKNRFYLIRMSVTNRGSSEAIVPQTELVDDSGQSYAEVNNGDGAPDWLGSVRQLSAKQTTQGNLLFDVPPKHYRLRIVAEEGQPEALVDLPLSFESDSEAPDVTTPLDRIPSKK
jgi:hypothetical protein